MARLDIVAGRRPSTLIQVAQRAGVSLTTASKVINNTGRISAETRARVLDAARELRFVPNPHARSLHSGRTSIVGALILDSKAQRFAMPLIIGADMTLSDINLSMIACDAKGDPERAKNKISLCIGCHGIPDYSTAYPEVYRVPVILRDIQGLSTEEASAILRIKPQTLKSRLHRGRLILRQHLGAFAGGIALHAREATH